MYKVYTTQGQGPVLAGEYLTFEEALKEAKEGISRADGSYAIQYPTGEWYDWEDE